MQALSSDLSSLLQLNQFALQVSAPGQNVAGVQPGVVAPDPSVAQANPSKFVNDAAVTAPNISGASAPFDMAMNDIASYKDVISAAQSGIAQMRADGEGIRDIIAQAQQGNLSQELLDKMQAEVDEKILDISIIKDAAQSNGPNNGVSSLSISDAPNLMGVNNSSEVMSLMSNGMTSYDMDINFDLDGINFNGSAKVAMGVDSNGTFQLAFDVTLDYDLSAIAGEGGITSPDAPATIESFLNSLDKQDGILSKASQIVDSAFEKIFDAVNASQGAGGMGDYINSSYLGKQIAQQSSSVFDSIMTNQLPGMALNLI